MARRRAKAAKTPQQMADAWAKQMANPVTASNYSAGIDRTIQAGVNPMALAADPQAEQDYIQGVQQSVASGRRNAALMAANPQDWATNAKQTGAARLSSGATKAKKKVDAHFAKWAPIYQQASAAAAAVVGPKSQATAMAKVAAALGVMMAAAGKA